MRWLTWLFGRGARDRRELKALLKDLKDLMTTIADIRDDVRAEKDVITAAADLLGKLHQQLGDGLAKLQASGDALVAANAANADLLKQLDLSGLQELHDQLGQNRTSLAAAVAANTIADPQPAQSPTPVAPPAPATDPAPSTSSTPTG